MLEQLQDEMYDFFILSARTKRCVDVCSTKCRWKTGRGAERHRSPVAPLDLRGNAKSQAQQLEAITARLGPVPVSRSNRSAAKSWALPVNWKRRANSATALCGTDGGVTHDH